MKKITVIVLLAMIASCNPSPEKDKKDSTPADTSFAYTTAQPVDWQWGNKENIRIVMRSLKAFEEDRMAASVKDFGDSITLEFDGLDATFSRDSAKQFLQQSRDLYKSVKVIMTDYESVKGRNGDEFVTLWYKEILEEKTGKIDSLDYMNDIKFKEGKIIGITERGRHYGVKK